MPGSLDLKDFIAGFILETDEHLHAVNRNLVLTSESLKQERAEPRAVRELYRSLHTIKGLASMVGADPIVDIAHEMEGILRLADAAGGHVDEASLDLLVQGTRAIEERVRVLARSGIAALSRAPAALLEALALAQRRADGGDPQGGATYLLPEDIAKSLTPADREQLRQAAQDGKRLLQVEFQPSPERAARGITITSVRERLGTLGDLVKVVPRSSPGAPTGIAFALLLFTEAPVAALAEAVGAEGDAVRKLDLEALPAAAAKPETVVPLAEEDAPSDDRNTSIRVDIRRLDQALEQLSALVVTRSRLTRVSGQLAAGGADTRELNAVIAENSRQLKRLRAAITAARMVPLAELLQRLPLVARGLTKDSDKAIDVLVQVGSAEVDKAVADRIFPAIVHLVRNAVDHAVEPRAERRRLGKPETATLWVICDDSAGASLRLTIRDDGRGVDRAAVARKAGRPIAADDDELLEQITLPGLSTREGVTRVSGRGMGMDIVRRTVELLGGTLRLTSTEGAGTTFTLRVPVSITIVDVLSFIAGGQPYVAPLAMIDEIVDVDAARLVGTPTPEIGRGPAMPAIRLIERRGEAIPFLPLPELLGAGAPTETSAKALVVNHPRGAIAVGIDRLLGQQEVVVRPLQDALVRLPGMAGATDLGDGRPTLVLDLASLGSSLLQRAG